MVRKLLSKAVKSLGLKKTVPKRKLGTSKTHMLVRLHTVDYFTVDRVLGENENTDFEVALSIEG